MPQARTRPRSSVPPYHVAAVSSVLSTSYVGRRVVHLERFEPVLWVEAVRAERATHAMVVPTMLNRILDVVEADGGGLPSLRSLAYGGGPMPRPVVERALRLLDGVGLVNAYGLTETSSTIAVLGPDDHRQAFASDDPAVRARLGSVGRVLPGVELSVRDRPAGLSRPASGARSGCGASRCRASTSVTRRSTRTTGSPPATPAGSTPTASCTSKGDSTTSSSAGARTSRRARSNPPCSIIRRWKRQPSSAYPTSSGASAWWPPSCCGRAQQTTETELRPTCAGASARPARRSGSKSGWSCPTARPGSSSVACPGRAGPVTLN